MKIKFQCTTAIQRIFSSHVTLKVEVAACTQIRRFLLASLGFLIITTTNNSSLACTKESIQFEQGHFHPFQISSATGVFVSCLRKTTFL